MDGITCTNMYTFLLLNKNIEQCFLSILILRVAAVTFYRKFLIRFPNSRMVANPIKWCSVIVDRTFYERFFFFFVYLDKSHSWEDY